jgi:hypothetical protein
VLYALPPSHASSGRPDPLSPVGNSRRHGLADEIAGVAIGAVLGAWAGLRRGKAVHPDGVVHLARLVVPGASAAPRAAGLLVEPREHRAVVRFSRSLGLPRPLPDLLGMSIRVIDAYGEGRHQDFLLVTSADYPVLHHVFLPATDVQHRPYSSSLPYRAGDDVFLVGALPDRRSPRPSGDNEFDRLDIAASSGRLAFHLGVAPLDGRFHRVAELVVGERLGPELDALRFNPFNTGGGLEPAGWLNGARDRAYKWSQAAWGRTREAGRALQREADRELERTRATPPRPPR